MNDKIRLHWFYLSTLRRDEDNLSLPLGDHGRQQGLGGVDTAQDIHPEDLLQGRAEMGTRKAIRASIPPFQLKMEPSYHVTLISCLVQATAASGLSVSWCGLCKRCYLYVHERCHCSTSPNRQRNLPAQVASLPIASIYTCNMKHFEFMSEKHSELAI